MLNGLKCWIVSTQQPLKCFETFIKQNSNVTTARPFPAACAKPYGCLSAWNCFRFSLQPALVNSGCYSFNVCRWRWWPSTLSFFFLRGRFNFVAATLLRELERVASLTASALQKTWAGFVFCDVKADWSVQTLLFQNQECLNKLEVCWNLVTF